MLHLSFQILAHRCYIGKSLAVKVHDIRSFHSEHPWLEALKAALPFFWLMLIATVLLTVFPQITLFLPGMMK